DELSPDPERIFQCTEIVEIECLFCSGRIRTRQRTLTATRCNRQFVVPDGQAIGQMNLPGFAIDTLHPNPRPDLDASLFIRCCRCEHQCIQMSRTVEQGLGQWQALIGQMRVIPNQIDAPPPALSALLSHELACRVARPDHLYGLVSCN